MKTTNNCGSEMYSREFNSNTKAQCAHKKTAREEKTMKKAIAYNANLSKLVILFVVVAICSAAVGLNGMGPFLGGSPSNGSPVNHNFQTSEPIKKQALQAYGKLP